MFLWVIFRPSKKIDLKLHRFFFFVKTHCGIANAHKTCHKSIVEIAEYMSVCVAAVTVKYKVI
jgi:hypothetical protein